MNKVIAVSMILIGTMLMLWSIHIEYDKPYRQFRESCNGIPTVCDCSTEVFRESIPRKEMRMMIKAIENGNINNYFDTPQLLEPQVAKAILKAGIICGKK